MSAPIPYTVQSGETLQDIAKKLGIKDWTKLKQYHNEQAGSGQQTSDIPYAGFILQTPPKDEIYTMNGETPPPDPVEEQKSAEQKQDQEKKKEEEEKKEEKASKSDHDGKYFVVHNAKCVCDKAENPKQTADLQVTTHSIIVLNDEQGKLAATEEDKTFIPPAATFGKCKLKPSSGGYLPCALAPAPKWAKTYESTQVMGKNTLTEISELQCTIGGKITIFKHGQTDSVSNAHADNTNPVELAMVNPAIEQPKKKEDYPSVTSIVLTKVENRTAFKEIDSKNKSSMIYLRKDEEASFKANLKSGNKQLTSWMVYSDHQGRKENRIFLREQIGTEFSQSFEGLGKFRIEGYGKPKNQDFEKGKYDKCDPSCSIDVEVVENTLIDIECTSADFTTRIDPSKNRKFRKGVPSVFKARFFIPDLTTEEKSRLTLSVQDGSGNTITEGVQENGEILTFTPKNTKAKYTIIARYTNDKGEVIEKQIAGETEGNAVLGISHGAEVVRPGTAMSFSVSKMKYKFGADNSPYDLTSDESSEIKWNLNGIPQGTGKSFTIPGSKLMAPGKYIVEAYSISANAIGKNAKKEDDDWHFEVKENDVVSFTLSGTPKVGKPITATVDKMVFADLLPNETVHWQGFSTPVTGKSITFTPKTPGTLNITSKIKGKGVTQKVNVVEAKIIQGFWNDFGGSEISHAAWGQKVDFCVKGENIEGEEIELAIYDSDNVSGDDLGYSNTENKLKITGKNDKTYASHRIELTKKVKDRTANDLSSEVKLYGKAKLLGFENSTLKDITPVEKTSKYLTVNNEKIVYRAIIGEQNGRARHMPVDYDIISWVYASTTYPKGTKLKIKIFEDINWAIDQECKELLTTGTVGEDGTLAAQINWSKLKDAKQNKKTKKYYAVIYDEKDNELLNGSSSDTLCNTTLIPQSILLKEASYTGAVIVGSEQVSNSSNCGGKFCIKKGSPKSELIREINIRLAGFGGNVPTDEFTERTEKMVKQFQRDYMKVPETGKVCGNVLKAIDEFTNKWGEKVSDYTCLCKSVKSIINKCSGFGKGQYKDQYSNKNKVERYHKYERPGMHRSLLWGVSALKYYLSIQNEYKFAHITAGYRCWEHNKYAGRPTTNHMGKAVDIQFLKKNILVEGKKEQNLPILRDIRDKLYTKYLDSKYNWVNGNNNFSLEPFGLASGQTWSWVHMDVREFDNIYLDDKFFTKTQDSLIGKSLTQLANELGFKDTCSCMSGGTSTNNNSNTTEKECICFKKGKVKIACSGKGSTVTNEMYEKEAERLGIDLAMIQAIAKQESKRESFWKEGQATILFERHKMWEYLKSDLKKTEIELKKLKEDDPSIVNNYSGGYGKYSEQYEKLDKAKKIDNATALKACSWGKFQVMGFNYSVAFSTPEEMEKAVNLCEIQQFYFFVGYIENTGGMINAMKNKKWEEIASKYNGSKWKEKNPDYASNIEKYYNEYKKQNGK